MCNADSNLCVSAHRAVEHFFLRQFGEVHIEAIPDEHPAHDSGAGTVQVLQSVNVLAESPFLLQAKGVFD